MGLKTIHASIIQKEQQAMFSFLRDIVAIPSQDGIEGAVIRRIKEEMEACGFREVFVDPMGNCIGKIGCQNAKHVLAFDAHIDTVDTGMLEQWSFDPYQGKEDDTYIYGRGCCDQKAGLAAMVYAGKILKDLELEDLEIVMVASTLEEDCEGLCWQYILEHKEVLPSAVISTEPTNMQIHIGHRGRTDIEVHVIGKSAHGAMPQLGINAVECMAEIVCEIKELSKQLREDALLGKGTINISSISSNGASKCAVPDRCSITIDRRLTYGETPDTAVEEIKMLPAVQKYNAEVKIMTFVKEAYTGMQFQVPCRFPVMCMETDHAFPIYVKEVMEALYHKTVDFSTWQFSTNGVAIQGIYQIPCIGLGPGKEDQAHSIDEFVSKEQMVQALESYVHLAYNYL